MRWSSWLWLRWVQWISPWHLNMLCYISNSRIFWFHSKERAISKNVIWTFQIETSKLPCQNQRFNWWVNKFRRLVPTDLAAYVKCMNVTPMADWLHWHPRGITQEREKGTLGVSCSASVSGSSLYNFLSTGPCTSPLMTVFPLVKTHSLNYQDFKSFKIDSWDKWLNMFLDLSFTMPPLKFQRLE